MNASGSPLCRCGHSEDAHEHYRKGGDCSVCGPEVCGRYRPAGRWSFVTRLFGR